ncbi:MAG: hypothetical protein DI529_14360 [Chryseobacterium sp.]|nr:MAG: hypothetical protein DI529_14360 [Chryseobacterium sp.]
MKTKILLASLLFSMFAKSQMSGNQIYGSNGNSYNSEGKSLSSNVQKIISSKNSEVYKINVLNNVKADSYVVTLGLNEEGADVKDCNSKINNRIQKFKSELQKMKIKTDNLDSFYVDFITQTKIYDYKVNQEGKDINATQIDKGFEIKKNIIFRLDDVTKFDEIVDLASQFQIFNIIKIEYHVNNTDDIYQQMFEEAVRINDKRRNLEGKLNDNFKETKPKISVNFYSIQPKEQYKTYQAYESSNVNYSEDYHSDRTFVRREQRKSSTFYYDAQKSNSYDSVMNKDTSLVGLQFVMEVSFVYEKDEPIKNEYHIITSNGEVKKLVLD